jgi:hypothetical protein
VPRGFVTDEGQFELGGELVVGVQYVLKQRVREVQQGHGRGMGRDGSRR